MNTSIYADNAATTKLDKNAFEVMRPFLLEEYGNASQPYSFSRSARQALSEARRTIAECIGADESEIFFTSGGSESDNWAINSALTSNCDHSRILVSEIDHHAVLNSAEALKRFGISVDYLEVTNTGIVLPSVLEKHIDTDTKLISVMLANNEIGTIEPIEELASIAHKNGILFHTDAVQAIGHINVNVQKLSVDMLSASAHKFNGPKGIGFLYVRNGVSLNPFIYGGSQEHGMRAGTENIPAIVGMAAALKINVAELDSYKSKMTALETILLTKLNESGLSFIHNGSDNHLPGNVSISFLKASGEKILHRMDLMNIHISTGSACDSKNTQISHVIKAIGVPKDYAEGTIRISLGRDNTESDAINIANSLIKILKGA